MKTLTPAGATAGSIIAGWAFFGVGAITEVGTMIPVLIQIEFWWNISFLAVFSSFFGFLMYFEAIKNAAAKGYKWLDGSVTSEANLSVVQMAERLGAERYKSFRLYQMNF